MAGTFSSLNTATTAIRYNQVAMDVAANNVANANTAGYVRRRVAAESMGAPAQVAMWATSGLDSTGGVRVLGIERLSEPLLDARSRTENSALVYLQTRSASLLRLESGLAEPTDDGVAAALSSFSASWLEASNTPDSSASKHQILGAATALVQAIGAQYTNTVAEQKLVADQALDAIERTNTAAQDLAALNKSMQVAKLSGQDTSALADQRDTLVMTLTELTGGKAVLRSDGGADFEIAGYSLVAGTTAQTLTPTTGVDVNGAATGEPIQVTGSPSAAVVSFPSGKLGATTSLLAGDLAQHMQQLNDFAQAFADRFNTAHQSGYTTAGAAGGALFSYNATSPAGTLQLAISNPDNLAVSGVAVPSKDNANAVLLGQLDQDHAAYTQIVNKLGTSSATVQRLEKNQETLTAQIFTAKEQISGVNLDEELLSLTTAQRSYEAAARVLTVMDSVLETLINRTGVTR